jgi:hypothetical protein
LRTLAVRRGLAPPDFFSMLRLAGGRCRSVLLDQRSTTQQHWRGPGISGSTQGYLALPLRQELCVATGRGEGVAGLCSTREAPRRTGVGPAYLIQPKATWHSPLGHKLSLTPRRLRGFARPERHHAALAWARHIWFNPRLPGTPPKVGALARARRLPGFARTRETPRSQA